MGSAGMDPRDEETAALAAAIRTPWTRSDAEPYGPPPAPPSPPPASPPPGYQQLAYPPPGYQPPFPPRPIGYIPVPVYAYPGAPPYPGPVWGPLPRVSQRQLGIAYLLWLFLGVLGVHHFYLRNYLRGVLYLLTGGFGGLGILVDLFLLPSLTRRRNAEAIGRLYALPR